MNLSAKLKHDKKRLGGMSPDAIFFDLNHKGL
jgi:hypothetical protein